MIFKVTYYLELRTAIIVYFASHFLPTMIELVVWTLQNINIFTWLKKYISINNKITNM